MELRDFWEGMPLIVSARTVHLEGVVWVRTLSQPPFHFSHISSLLPGSSRGDGPGQIQEGIIEHPSTGKGSVAQGQRSVRGNFPAGIVCRRQIEVSRWIEVLERAIQVST